MTRASTITQVIRRVENWPEVFSLKSGLGTRELSLISFRNGLKVACRRKSCDWDIVRGLLLTGGYQRSTAYLKEGHGEATVLDLGGNIGCFSLLAAVQSPLSRVRAYEPGSPNIRMFKLNCLLNPEVASRVELYEEAVGGTTRQAIWQFDATNPGGSSLYGRGSDGEAIQVRSFTEIVDSIRGPITLAKIDVEGSEFEMLEATPAEIWKRIPALTIEVHDDPSGRRTQQEARSHLESLGYRVEADDEFAWFCYR
jgi:FkbM family methyltransferase